MSLSLNRFGQDWATEAHLLSPDVSTVDHICEIDSRSSSDTTILHKSLVSQQLQEIQLASVFWFWLCTSGKGWLVTLVWQELLLNSALSACVPIRHQVAVLVRHWSPRSTNPSCFGDLQVQRVQLFVWRKSGSCSGRTDKSTRPWGWPCLGLPNGGIFYFGIFFPLLLVASVASMAPGGLWWLLWLLLLLWLLAPMADLSSIDQSISEACSPGACWALDTP